MVLWKCGYYDFIHGCIVATNTIAMCILNNVSSTRYMCTQTFGGWRLRCNISRGGTRLILNQSLGSLWAPRPQSLGMIMAFKRCGYVQVYRWFVMRVDFYRFAPSSNVKHLCDCNFLHSHYLGHIYQVPLPQFVPFSGLSVTQMCHIHTTTSLRRRLIFML